MISNQDDDGVKRTSKLKYTSLSKTETLCISIGLVLLSWTIDWEATMIATVTPAVTSILAANNISSILSTVTFVLHTVFLPIYSKVANKTGRAEAYSVAILLYTMAFVIMASAPDFETLVAGQVVYALGSSGTQVLGPIVIAGKLDMTSVSNRGLFQGLYSLPALICLFVAPYVAQALLDLNQWRWIYGMVPILLLVTSSPLLFGLWHAQLKQTKEIKKNQSTFIMRTNTHFLKKLVRIANELDFIGSLLLIAALSLTLFPLVLAIPRWGRWKSAMTINTLLTGCIGWILFALWETKFAISPILPWSNSSFQSRTAIFGVLACSTVTVISATNWQYFATYLQVSRKINAKEATYLERGYNVGYIIAQLVAGYMMKRTAVWRPFIWVGSFILILGVLLMIPARLPTSSDWFLIISQTLAGSGSGLMHIPIVVAVQSCVEHQDVAMITAFLQIGGSIAASIGSTLAGTIWNTLLPGLFKKYVPGNYDYNKIVQDIHYAISLPKDQYDGVVQSYSQVQKILTIIAAACSVLAFLFSLPMKSFGLERTDHHARDTIGKVRETDESSIQRLVTRYGVASLDIGLERD